MFDQIVTAITGIGILGGAYLIDLLVGVTKVAFTPQLKFSLSKMLKDLVRAVMLAGSIVGLVALLQAINWWGKGIGADLSILNGVSTSVLFAGILGGAVWYASNALKNILAFVNSKDTQVAVDEGKADYAGIAKDTVKGVETIVDFVVPKADPKVAKKHLAFEEEGGVGQAYSVDISSYDAFRAAVLGRGFNIDNAYGWQCWDGAALLWQQLGLSLVTGNGNAIGCWDLERTHNAYDKFDLVTDVNSLQRGDVVVMRPNHIGFFDGWNGDYMRILGQNQGGTPTYTQGGYTTGAFNLANVNKSAFAGAFRYRGWAAVAPAPAPTPAPARKSNEEVAKEVMRGDWGNNPERKQRLTDAGYDYAAIQAIVNGAVPAPQPAQSSAPAIGDKVTTVATKDAQTGAVLLTKIVNDGNSVFSEVNGKGNAVLTKGGVVRCAVPVDSLRKV